MTLGADRGEHMSSFSLRASDDVVDAVDRLEATGLFASSADAIREGVRRVVHDPELLERDRGYWRTSHGERLHVRLPDDVLERMDVFVEYDRVESGAELVRTAVDVMAREYLDEGV